MEREMVLSRDRIGTEARQENLRLFLQKISNYRALIFFGRAIAQ